MMPLLIQMSAWDSTALVSGQYNAVRGVYLSEHCFLAVCVTA